jgi:ATP-dependent helicase/nuclease subunit A
MNLEQIKSSDPSISVWVSASAGTGKTKVLTDRVLRLLLTGAAPHKILCLTFTNAAAAEMLHRINKELLAFSRISQEDLKTKLYNLLGREARSLEMTLARTLFKQLLQGHEQIAVQTIHAFCQGILHKFPFEAGVSTGFQVIDEYKSDEVLQKISRIVFSENDDSITQALEFVATNLHDSTLNNLLREIINSKVKFKSLIDRFKNAENYESFLRQEMNSSPVFIESHYFDYIPVYAQMTFEQLKAKFLTLQGAKRKSLLSKAEARADPEQQAALFALQDQVFKMDQALKTARLIETSKYLFILASNIISKYEEYKECHGFLDYDDLIFLTQKLLGSSEFRQWVLYKLDGGLSHILIDEAQDTSPQQWLIIEALIEEFYSGGQEDERTVFVVGDEKQSIYSFQGASLGAFVGMSKYLKEQMDNVAKPYKVIDLAHSYRSTPAVLNIVASVFARLSSMPGDLFSGMSALEAVRKSHIGRVELWPVVSGHEKEEIFWPLLNPDKVARQPGEQLAQNILLFLKAELSSNRILPSKNRPIEPGDIMILLRKRGRFAGQLIKALEDGGLEVGGIDRLVFTDSLEILDLISVAKFVLQPLDDLNLACLLKSPFFGLGDEELKYLFLALDLEVSADVAKPYNLREGSSRETTLPLWHKLQQAPYLEIYQKLQLFQQIYLKYSMYQFFNIISSENQNDVIKEFLYCVSSFSKSTSTSLQEFILWLEKSEYEIKRDVSSSNKIRVMTVHGSKGLQAGMVILADTMQKPLSKGKILWTNQEIALMKPDKANANNYLTQHKNDNASDEYREYLRLLYVAMTRAEDRLIVAGHSSQKKVQEGSWYDIISNSMTQIDCKEVVYDFCQEAAIVYEDDGGFSAPRATNLSCKVLAKKEVEARGSDEEKFLRSLLQEREQQVYGWVALASIFATSYAATAGDSDRVIANNPLKPKQGLRYGQIFHKIMEDFVRTREDSLAKNHPMIELLPLAQRAGMVAKIQNLLIDHEFQEILAMSPRTEITIGLDSSNGIEIGRIDLMAKDDQKIIILDYKTDKNPGDVPDKYKKQLGLYREAIEKLYPCHKVETKILWLENLSFSKV